MNIRLYTCHINVSTCAEAFLEDCVFCLLSTSVEVHTRLLREVIHLRTAVHIYMYVCTVFILGVHDFDVICAVILKYLSVESEMTKV